MSVKSVREVRSGKPFKPFDLIVYGLLAAAVVGLFIAFVFTRVSSPLAEVYVDCDNERVLVWSVAEGTLAVTNGWRDRVDTVEENGTVRVTVWTNAERTEFNIIELTSDGASVADANCSAHKDCVYSASVTDTSGVIVCVPHRLRIYSSDDFSPSLG